MIQIIQKYILKDMILNIKFSNSKISIIITFKKKSHILNLYPILKLFCYKK